MKSELESKQEEVDVLREMIRSSKLQLKGKENELHRLKIKIKRLEKTNDTRETDSSFVNNSNFDAEMLKTASCGI
jgi:hypothetical protein